MGTFHVSLGYGMNKHFQELINVECRINVGPFDYEMEGVWMSLAVHVRYPQSALECLVKGCKA